MLEAVREAAAETLERGAARVEVEGDVVALRPRNPRAAEVVIDVHESGQWWVYAADGPGFELWHGGPEDWLAEIRAMVAAAVAGRYEDGMAERRRRSLLRPWIWKTETAWEGTFHTPGGPTSVSHVGAEGPRRTFEPY